jgi:hypothetical protein
MPFILRLEHLQANVHKWVFLGNSLIITGGLTLIGIAFVMLKPDSAEKQDG